MERFLNSERKATTPCLIFVFVGNAIQVADANCAAILGIIRLALFVAPILACKFSMDKPLTAEAMILFEIQEEFRLKPHLLDRVYSQN
jgi:predicted permease